MSGPYGPPPGGAPQGPGPQGPGAPGAYPGPPGPAAQHGGPGFGPGQPSGFQGQGAWSGGQGYAPATPKAALGLDKILALSVAGLGVLNFIWGFLPGISYGTTSSAVINSYLGYLPVVLLVAGLLSLGPWEPSGGKYTFVVAILSTVALIAVVIGLINVADGADVGIGLILLLVFAILQAAAAVGAYLFDAGILKQRAKILIRDRNDLLIHGQDILLTVLDALLCALFRIDFSAAMVRTAHAVRDHPGPGLLRSDAALSRTPDDQERRYRKNVNALRHRVPPIP